MAYLWSVPTYIRMPSSLRRVSLGAWGAAVAFFFCAVFLWRIIPLYIAVLFLLIITSFHFFRDYEFFYRQLISGLRDRRRTLSLTCMLTGFYLMVVFGAILFDLEKTRSLFGAPLAPSLARAVFWGSAALFALSGVFLMRDKKRRMRLRALLREPAQAAVLVASVAALSLLSRLSTLDLFVLFAAWHYSLWLAFTARMISAAAGWQAATALSTHETQRTLGIVLDYWKRDMRSFFVLTAAFYAVLLAVYYLSYLFDLTPAIAAARHQSFFWGVGGYVFFSIAHILFTALPRPAPAPAVQ